METRLNCSGSRPEGEGRMTKDVNERERKLIRESNLPYRELAKIFHLTEAQIRYIRSSESKQAQRATKVWNPSEEQTLMDMYEEHGWAPQLIARAIPSKTYTQVYRKMTREFKGR